MSVVDPGLCLTCVHGRLQRTARGSTFWRCLRADTDPHFPRYPRLPVFTCPGYEAGPSTDKDREA